MNMNKNLPRSGVAVICACIVAATALGSNQLPRAEIFAGLPGVLNVAISPNGQILASDRYGPSGTSIEVYDAGTGVVRRTIDLGAVNKLRAYEWQRTLAIDIDGGSVRKMLLDDTGNTWVTGSTLYATRTGRPDVVAMATMSHSVARARGVLDTADMQPWRRRVYAGSVRVRGQRERHLGSARPAWLSEEARGDDFSDNFSLMQDQIGPAYESTVIARSPARAAV